MEPYVDAALQGLTAVLALPVLGVMAIGIAVGILVGVLPGLGGLFAMAIMLPFTFDMSPAQAFAFLLGMHSVTNTAGEITAVLFAVPGEASAAAAILDGHPMAKRGEAGRAIGANLSSSLVGALIGAGILAAALPLMRPLVLSLASPELFMLTMLGVTFISSLAGKRVAIGILVAGLGFLLSTVGQDPQTGQLRYTLGSLFLWEGMPLVPMVLGLFAIPELIELSISRGAIAGQGEQVAKVGKDIGEGFKDTFRYWKLVGVSSLFGTLIGFIPGLGGSVAQWVAYGWARQRSKNRDMFGKGSIEGVLAPGAATNAKEGGALIPTILFGVPGSAAMTLLLAAFLIVGIQPGPKMLTQFLPVTFSMIWVLVIAQFVAVGVCMVFIRQIVALTKVNVSIIVPFILSLILIGGYTESNNMIGVVITLLFGMLGYIMVVLDWPRPPMILAFILGHLSEIYLFRSIQAYGSFGWVGRPLVILLFLAIVAQIVYTIIQSRPRSKDVLAV